MEASTRSRYDRGVEAICVEKMAEVNHVARTQS
jgi:hypothetical protein